MARPTALEASSTAPAASIRGSSLRARPPPSRPVVPSSPPPATAIIPFLRRGTRSTLARPGSGAATVSGPGGCDCIGPQVTLADHTRVLWSGTVEQRNRRLTNRVRAPVEFRPPQAPRFEMVIDISPGGIRVIARDCMEAGERLPLELRLPDGVVIEIWAEVAWSDPDAISSGPGCETGLRFTDIPDHSRWRLARIASSGS
ncbi:MAG: PilZ domain-containing protein [Chloroflexi bacterium]|nr:MAG: PilZ domain-containing protein [Chloroflexota bacterium]